MEHIFSQTLRSALSFSNQKSFDFCVVLVWAIKFQSPSCKKSKRATLALKTSQKAVGSEVSGRILTALVRKIVLHRPTGVWETLKKIAFLCVTGACSGNCHCEQ